MELTRREELERYVLGTVLSDQEYWPLCGILTPETFTGSNGVIFACLSRHMREEGHAYIFKLAEETGLLSEILELLEWHIPTRLAHINVLAEHKVLYGQRDLPKGAGMDYRKAFMLYTKTLIDYAGKRTAA